MLRQQREKQQKMNVVIMEQLVPEDHFLRKVDKAVDFSFIYDLCAPLYCADNGRPAIDPEILFRMLLVGYLYGIKSEVRLEEEINYNIAYKWFCGLDLTEKVLFQINWRDDITTTHVVRYDGVLYDITRIDDYEGRKEDLKLYCARRARQS